MTASCSVSQSITSVKPTRNVETEGRFPDSSPQQSRLRKRSTFHLTSPTHTLEGNSSLSIQPESPQVCTPTLPHELWLQILVYACRDERDVTITGSHYTRSHSFLNFVPAHSHLPERTVRYNAWLRWKASLTTVSSLFHAIAQEMLYEDVWITNSKDGRRLAERLGGSVNTRITRISGPVTRKPQQSWWRRFSESNRKTKQDSITASHPPPGRSSYGPTHKIWRSDPGRFIRRLRVETSATDQCSPHDLLLILQHCPGLLVFEDCRSIRRPTHPLLITGSEVVPFEVNMSEQKPDSSALPLLTTDVLAQTLLSRPLKRVTWTNYAHDGGNFDRAVKVYEHVLVPFLVKARSDLEVLEIITSSGGMLMGPREPETSWAVAGSRGRDHLISEPKSVVTRQFVSMNPPGVSAFLTDLSLSSKHFDPLVTLPSLKSLKATLDNATFAILSTWSMPSLRNLSVVSPDFKYGLEGFRQFLEVHGDTIQQLELGYSSGDLEEFWITEPSQSRQRSRIRLDVWCPNLKEFICSADAEWNWESPDWIAPHVLLPAHPRLEFIGVRGLEKRLINDAAEFRRTSSVEEYPYFMLLQQFSSMLRAEAFPLLRSVRDLSWESEKIRRSGKLCLGSTSAILRRPPSLVRHVSHSFPFLRPNRLLSSGTPQSGSSGVSSHVLRFWDEVLEKCTEQGVLVENYQGVALTRHLRNSLVCGE